MDLAVGCAIKYRFHYSNEEAKFGLIVKIIKDINFAYMIHLVSETGEIDIVPYSIIKYKII